MKKIFFLITFLLLISSISNSQWVFQNSAIQTALGKIFVFNDTGYITSGREIQKTTNGGNNWTFLVEFSYTLSSSYFLNSLTGYVVTSDGKINKTTTGGVTWQEYTSAMNGPTYYHALYFVNENTGFIGGSGGFHSSVWTLIKKTTNGGIDCFNVFYASNYGHFRNFYFVNEIGYVVGDGPRIMKTTNLGGSWFSLVSPSSNNLGSVWFLDVNTGFVTGGVNSISTIYKTTNGGINWQGYNFSINSPFTSIFFTNNSTGYVTADSGKILKTTDIGQSWNFLATNTPNRLNSIFFVDSNTGYAAGGSNNVPVILKTTNGGGNIVGINNINSEIPERFSLSQNYPNPFNPVTIIRFQIKRLSDVKLIIYDLLGREVATLVNEELKPGTYETDWDASNFSSGVYSYKIISEDYIETKKMVLMK